MFGLFHFVASGLLLESAVLALPVSSGGPAQPSAWTAQIDVAHRPGGMSFADVEAEDQQDGPTATQVRRRHSAKRLYRTTRPRPDRP